LEEHWPTKYPLHDYGFNLWCRSCTKDGEREDDGFAPTPWPCPPLEVAIQSDCATA
jgi:hypothetical protein